jgi:hypothetical protein
MAPKLTYIFGAMFKREINPTKQEPDCCSTSYGCPIQFYAMIPENLLSLDLGNVIRWNLRGQ